MSWLSDLLGRECSAPSLPAVEAAEKQRPRTEGLDLAVLFQLM